GVTAAFPETTQAGSAGTENERHRANAPANRKWHGSCQHRVPSHIRHLRTAVDAARASTRGRIPITQRAEFAGTLPIRNARAGRPTSSAALAEARAYARQMGP